MSSDSDAPGGHWQVHGTSTCALRLLLALCALLPAARSARAQEPAYLSAWPAVERVLADHQGEDYIDTLARQIAALNVLDRAMEDLADDRRWTDLTADELALRGRLRGAAARIREEVNGTLSSELGEGFHWPWEQAPRAAWYSRQWDYESDPAFRDATLSRYLSSDLRAELEVRKAGSDARGQAAGRELMRAAGQRDYTWLTMTPQEREAFRNVQMALIVLLGLMLVREMRRFGIRRSDPLVLRAGFRRYPLDLTSGILEQYESNTGGLNEGFWLRGDYGWTRIGVRGAYARIPEGHMTTAVRARGWKSQGNVDGPCVLFFDHDAGTTRPVEGDLRKMFAPKRWVLLPVLGLAMLSGATNNSVPLDTPLTRGLLVAALVWIPATLLLRWVGNRRYRRFLKRSAPIVMAAALEHAEELRPRINLDLPFPGVPATR